MSNFDEPRGRRSAILGKSLYAQAAVEDGWRVLGDQRIVSGLGAARGWGDGHPVSMPLVPSGAGICHSCLRGSCGAGSDVGVKDERDRLSALPLRVLARDSGQLDAPSCSARSRPSSQRRHCFRTGVVEAAAAVAKMPAGKQSCLPRTQVIGGARFSNPRLRLVGSPDGLVTANGALQPVEINPHQAASAQQTGSSWRFTGCS